MERIIQTCGPRYIYSLKYYISLIDNKKMVPYTAGYLNLIRIHVWRKKKRYSKPYFENFTALEKI